MVDGYSSDLRCIGVKSKCKREYTIKERGLTKARECAKGDHR